MAFVVPYGPGQPGHEVDDERAQKQRQRNPRRWTRPSRCQTWTRFRTPRTPSANSTPNRARGRTRGLRGGATKSPTPPVRSHQQRRSGNEGGRHAPENSADRSSLRYGSLMPSYFELHRERGASYEADQKSNQAQAYQTRHGWDCALDNRFPTHIPQV